MENAQGMLTFAYCGLGSMVFMGWAIWKISRQDKAERKADENGAHPPAWVHNT